MGTDNLLASVMAEFEQSGWTSRLREILFANRSHLMQSADVPASLIGALTKSPGDMWPSEAHILETLIDEARMQIENEGEYGHEFLSILVNTIHDFVEKKQLSPNVVTVLTTCYARAKVDVPEILASVQIAQMEENAKNHPPPPPDLNKMMKNLAQETGGDSYAMHEQLREIAAGMPEDAKLAFTREISSLSHPSSWSMATYWLLAPAMSIREQAALALLYRARAGKLNGNLVRRLPMLRSWMPADTARTVVDEIIREMRRRGLPPSPLGRAAKIIRICATPPDGVGAQSLAIVTKRKIGMILTKAGYGVKDAFVIPCRGAREISGILQHMEALDARDVPMATVRRILGAALADGIEHDLPPAHGLLDVASDFGLEDARPHRMTLAAWLEALDPEGMIDALSPQMRGRLINQAGDLFADIGIIDSWFEDNAPVRELLQSTPDPVRQEKKLIAYLDGRRAFWAERLFQTAGILKDAGEDWLGLAVTASALLEGRPIAKTPLMLLIVDNTLDAWYDQAGNYPETGDEPEIETGVFTVPDDPGKFLAAIGMAEGDPAWLDGYLTTVVIAPKTVAPPQWISPLLEKATTLAIQDDATVLINLALGRYNEIGMELAEQGELPGFSDLSDVSLTAWALGFEQGLAMAPAAWKGRSVAKSDRKLIKLIGQIASGRKTDFDPRAMIANWIKVRFAMRL